MYTAVLEHHKTGEYCRYYGENLKNYKSAIFKIEPEIEGFSLKMVVYRIQENVCNVGDEIVKYLPSFREFNKKLN